MKATSRFVSAFVDGVAKAGPGGIGAAYGGAFEIVGGLIGVAVVAGIGGLIGSALGKVIDDNGDKAFCRYLMREIFDFPPKVTPFSLFDTFAVFIPKTSAGGSFSRV